MDQNGLISCRKVYCILEKFWYFTRFPFLPRLSNLKPSSLDYGNHSSSTVTKNIHCDLLTRDFFLQNIVLVYEFGRKKLNHSNYQDIHNRPCSQSHISVSGELERYQAHYCHSIRFHYLQLMFLGSIIQFPCKNYK